MFAVVNYFIRNSRLNSAAGEPQRETKQVPIPVESASGDLKSTPQTVMPRLTDEQRDKIKTEVGRIAKLPPEERKEAISAFFQNMVREVLSAMILEILGQHFPELRENRLEEMVRLLSEQVPAQGITELVREEIAQHWLDQGLYLSLFVDVFADQEYVIQKIEYFAVNKIVDAMKDNVLKREDLETWGKMQTWLNPIDLRVFDSRVSNETLQAESGKTDKGKETCWARWMWNKVTRYADELKQNNQKTVAALGFQKQPVFVRQFQDIIIAWAKRRCREKQGKFTAEEFAPLSKDLAELARQELPRLGFSNEAIENICKKITSDQDFRFLLMYEVASAQRFLSFSQGFVEFAKAKTVDKRLEVHQRYLNFYAGYIQQASDCRILGQEHARLLNGVSHNDFQLQQEFLRMKEQIRNRIVAGSFSIDEYLAGLESSGGEELDPSKIETLRKALRDWSAEIGRINEAKDRRIEEVSRKALSIFDVSSPWFDLIPKLLTIHRFEMVQDAGPSLSANGRITIEVKAMESAARDVMAFDGKGAQAEEAVTAVQIEADKEGLREEIQTAHEKMDEKLGEFFVLFEHFLACLGFPIASLTLQAIAQSMERKRQEREKQNRVDQEWFHDWIVQTMERQRAQIPEKSAGRAMAALLAKSQAVS